MDKLLTLERELATLEQIHGMSLEEFLQRYQAGQMGDDLREIDQRLYA